MSDTRLDRIESKIDVVIDRVSAIDATLSSQHEVLVQHIARTKALEAIVEPLHKEALMVAGAWRMVGIFGGIVGFVSAVYEILSFYRRSS
jgi:hypothetical protein